MKTGLPMSQKHHYRGDVDFQEELHYPEADTILPQSHPAYGVSVVSG